MSDFAKVQPDSPRGMWIIGTFPIIVCLIFVIESPRTDLKTHLSHDTLVSVSEGDEMRFTPFLYPES